MAVSYNRLWKLLIDKKMTKASLRKEAGIAPNTMTKLSRDEAVASCLYTQIPESRINTELFNYHQKTE